MHCGGLLYFTLGKRGSYREQFTFCSRPSLFPFILDNDCDSEKNANVFSYFLSLKLGQGVCLKDNKRIKMGCKTCNYLW